MRKITIPTKLEEITLKQYLALQKEIKEDNEFHTQISLIKILCGLTSVEVLAMPKADFDEIITTLTNTLNQKAEHSQTFGNYGFIPNWDKISTAELIDIETGLQQENILQAVAVMYRPIAQKYKDLYTLVPYDIDKVNEEEVLSLPCTAYLGAVSFFLTLLDELLIYIPNYMSMMEMTEQEMKILEKNGVGIPRLMQSLEEICSNMRKSLNSMSTLSYTTLPT
jgi:hypothetical protein